MTREKDDPEKRNLLNVHREEKKKRQYLGSRSKIERKSGEFSNSEHRKRSSASYKVSSTEHRPEGRNQSRSRIAPYDNEKKDSWWFWQNEAPPPMKEEDSCSCVSCALKKIVSSEYACIGCLLLLFTISIIVAFLVVFKNVPNIGGDCKEIDCKKCNNDKPSFGYTTTCSQCKDCGVADSERLKRKIDILSSKQLNDGLLGLNEFQKNDKKGYDDVLSGHDGIPGSPQIEFGPSFRELTSLTDPEHKMSLHDIDLSTILYSDKYRDPQSSERLRDFYKKLVQTDAKIKSLKKYNKIGEELIHKRFLKSPERSRRSLKLYHYPNRYRTLRQRRSILAKHQRGIERHGIKNMKAGNKTRLRRYGGDSEEPTGFIIEKKKLLVQYKPGKKHRVPVKKCQHAPKDSHTHEKAMMHPFYKNTKKLDELLDKFLNKNLPEIMSDPFGLDEFFKRDRGNKLCKHPKPHKNINIIGSDTRIDQIPKPNFKYKAIKDEPVSYNPRTNSVSFKMQKSEPTTKYERDFFNHELNMISNEKKKLVTASPNDFEIMLSVSTIMNPDYRLSSPHPSAKTKVPKVENSFKKRKIMQLEAGEDEEVLGYEDFKEVLTDDMDSHDEMEKPGDRRKREDSEEVSSAPPPRIQNFNPPFARVQNPNWKCAMPLYADEINSMMTNKDATKVDLPKPTDQIEAEYLNQRRGGDLGDVEYMEDYLSHKYDRLVEQAQAYSDYGVLDGKKESRNEKDSPTADGATNHKVKLKPNDHKYAVFGINKKGRVPRVVVRKAASPERRHNDYKETVDEDMIMEMDDQKVGATEQNGHFSLNDGSEGIRIEIKPSTTTRDDSQNNADLAKMVAKHIKVKQFKKPTRAGRTKQIHSTTNAPSYPTGTYVYNAKAINASTETTTVFKNPEENINNNDDLNLSFAITKTKRRLLATDAFESSNDFRNHQNTLGHGRDNKRSNNSSIDRFIQNLDLSSSISNDDKKILKEYIEKIRNMNVRIYSTPHTFEYKDTVLVKHESTTRSTTNVLAPVDPFDSIVSINTSEVKFDNFWTNNLFGKILLTVKNPEFEDQKFNLAFNLPLVYNFNEQFDVNDNFNVPYDNYPFQKFTEIYPALNDFNMFTMNDTLNLNYNFISRRHKRLSNLTAAWIELASTEAYNNEDNVLSGSNETVRTPLTRGTIEHTMTAVSNSNHIDLHTTATPIAVNVTDVTSKISAVNSSNPGRPARDVRSANPSDNMTLSDFFSLVSNWFKSLDYDKIEQSRNVSGSATTKTLLKVTSISPHLSNFSVTSTTESAYPMYDSDMIENIGHRSRVLLSVEDKVTNATKESKVVNHTAAANFTVTDKISDGFVFNVTMQSPFEFIHESNATTIKDTRKQTSQVTKKSSKKKSKALFRRKADDSNLIFWNDIYDDEYGIQTDKMDNYMKDKVDNSVGDKLAVKDNDFIKRSGRWVQNKIKKFAKNLKMNPHSDGVFNDFSEGEPSVHSDNLRVKERVRRSSNHNIKSLGKLPQMNRNDFHTVGKKQTDQKDEIEVDYPEIDQKSLFAALSVNMREVCKKAALAVEQAKNAGTCPDAKKIDKEAKEVKEGGKQGSIANALMRQLVRLLTDLVDYQVQQKTCAKLPPDLEAFLDWLVNAKDDDELEPEKQSSDLKSSSQEDEELIDELQAKQDDAIAEEKHDRGADRFRYADCLRSVEDLLLQYDSMTPDEKSKMVGVKPYLEKQMAFLNRQLSTYELFHFLDNREASRRKRAVTKEQHSARGKLRKFIKGFGKHTKTTRVQEDSQVTDIVNSKKVINEGRTKPPPHDEAKILTKRNLKDVYYRAVAEAKKYSTVKNVHKKGTVSHDTSTVRSG